MIKTNQCPCAICLNRESEDCGRYPEFVPEGHEDYDEDWFIDCKNCDGECPTFYCVYFEPDGDNGV